MPYTLIATKNSDRQSLPFDSMEAAFDAAEPLIMDGYICRVADDQGVVQYTQALRNGRIEVYRGDATESSALPSAQSPIPARRPWWKFWG